MSGARELLICHGRSARFCRYRLARDPHWPALLRSRGPISPLARAIRSRQIQQGVVAQAPRVTLTEPSHLDDLQGEEFSGRFGLTIRRERGPAVLDGLT